MSSDVQPGSDNDQTSYALLCSMATERAANI